MKKASISNEKNEYILKSSQQTNWIRLLFFNFPTILLLTFLNSAKKGEKKSCIPAAVYARAFLALGFIQSLVIMCLMWTILLTHGLLLVSSSLVSGSVAVSLRDGLSQGRMKPVHVQGEEGGG